MRTRGAAAFEDLDDDHATAATWAGMGGRHRLGTITGTGIAGLFLRNRHIEQLAYLRDVLCSGAVGEEAVVADSMEPVWQHVYQEPADELIGGECHDLLAVAPFGAIVFPLEGDAVAIK